MQSFKEMYRVFGGEPPSWFAAPPSTSKKGKCDCDECKQREKELLRKEEAYYKAQKERRDREERERKERLERERLLNRRPYYLRDGKQFKL